MTDRNASARRAPGQRTAAPRRAAAPRGAAPRYGTAPRRSALPARRAPGRNGRQTAPGDRYALIKWVLLAALLVYAWLVVGANSARNVDFSVIAARMASAPGIAALKAMDENALQDRLGTTPEGCEGWLMYGSEEIMDVSEVLVAKGDEAALDRLEAAALARVEAQLNVFRSYGVDQKDLLEAATVLRRGSYFFYAVGEYADRWEDLFLSAIR